MTITPLNSLFTLNSSGRSFTLVLTNFSMHDCLHRNGLSSVAIGDGDLGSLSLYLLPLNWGTTKDNHGAMLFGERRRLVAGHPMRQTDLALG